MMNCKECRALLDSRPANGLDGKLQEALDAHLEACPACRMASQVLRDARSLDDLDEVPAQFSSAWRQRITQEEVPPVKQFPRITRWLAVAAALFVLVGGTWMVGRDRVRTADQGSVPAAGAPQPDRNYYGSPDGMRDFAMLEDAPAESAGARTLTKEQAAEKIIRSARMELSTREFDKDVEAVTQALARAGGRVESATLYNSYGSLRVAYYTLRVPSSQLDTVITALRGIGRLVSFSESSEDVSEQYADTENRLLTQRTKMERLQALLAKAESVEDLITIESSISDTQYEIDRLTGQLRGMDSKVDYSTLSLTINELGPIETSQDREETLWERVKNGVKAAFEGFVQLMSDLVVFLSIALPYLLVLVLLVLIIRYIIKRRKNK